MALIGTNHYMEATEYSDSDRLKEGEIRESKGRTRKKEPSIHSVLVQDPFLDHSNFRFFRKENTASAKALPKKSSIDVLLGPNFSSRKSHSNPFLLLKTWSPLPFCLPRHCPPFSIAYGSCLSTSFIP